MRRRSPGSTATQARRVVAVWLVLAAVFLAAAGFNLYLAATCIEQWPLVLGVVLVLVGGACGWMAWHERRRARMLL